MKIYSCRSLWLVLFLLCFMLGIVWVDRCGTDYDYIKRANRENITFIVVRTVAYVKATGRIPVSLKDVKDESGRPVEIDGCLDPYWPHWNPIGWYEKCILWEDRRPMEQISLYVLRDKTGTPNKLVFLPPFPEYDNFRQVYTVILPNPPYQDKEIQYVREKVPEKEFVAKYGKKT